MGILLFCAKEPASTEEGTTCVGTELGTAGTVWLPVVGGVLKTALGPDCPTCPIFLNNARILIYF